LEHKCCKYILLCLVHKENKDISTKPSEQRPGRLREAICEERDRDIAEARAIERAERQGPGVEKNDDGDLDH
jgi:hypothetical protein